MIDHTGLTVSDVTKSKAFYRDALAPLGYSLLIEFDQDAGFGVAPKPDFWIGQGKLNGVRGHVAFRAVGILGPDDHQLGRAFAVEHSVLGIQIDGHRRRHRGRVLRRAGTVA